MSHSTVTLCLSDRRTITAKVDVPVEEFVRGWQEALRDDRVVVLGTNGRLEYVNARSIVSVR